MDIRHEIETAPGGVLLFDGGMGSMIQRNGLAQPGELADLLVLTNPEAITAIHAEYVAAGADIITTNTFNANAHNVAKAGSTASVRDIYAAAVACARTGGAKLVAADIGPLGELLEPYGDLEEDEAAALFAEQAQAARDAQADLIIVETMSDLTEMGLALAAAHEHTDLPVIATMSFDANGFTMFGVTPENAARALGEQGAAAVGMNCSTGPENMISLVERMRAVTDLPIVAQPNAGLPKLGPNGTTTYDMTPEIFAEYVARILEAGATCIGGCCGTTPAFIAQLNTLRSKRA